MAAGELCTLWCGIFTIGHCARPGVLSRSRVVVVVVSDRYLFYLKRIGIAVSPLSNNLLFLNYYRNPFYKVRGRACVRAWACRVPATSRMAGPRTPIHAQCDRAGAAD